MKFNYQAEKIKFDKKWDCLKKEYEESGMSEETIKKMRAYDWNDFKKERNFCLHNQHIEEYFFEFGSYSNFGEKNILMRKNETAFIKEESYFSERKNGWIDALDTENLIKAVKSLDQDKLDLITKFVYEQKTMQEIAQELGITKSAVSQRLSTIKKYIKNFKRA